MFVHTELALGLRKPVDKVTMMRIINKIRAAVTEDEPEPLVQYLHVKSLSNEHQETLDGGD
jgi:hypothetical protein